MKAIRIVLQMKWFYWLSKGLCSYFHYAQCKPRLLNTFRIYVTLHAALSPEGWNLVELQYTGQKVFQMIVFQIILHCNEGQNTIAYGKTLFVHLPSAKTTITKNSNNNNKKQWLLYSIWRDFLVFILVHFSIKKIHFVFSMTIYTINNMYRSSPRKMNIRILTELCQVYTWSTPGLLQYAAKWTTNKTEISLQSRSKCITVCNPGTMACILN